jgi:NAD(P)-dependent dehydrogenase (short-subunit alcohol dehydrogenase family)
MTDPESQRRARAGGYSRQQCRCDATLQDRERPLRRVAYDVRGESARSPLRDRRNRTGDEAAGLGTPHQHQQRGRRKSGPFRGAYSGTKFAVNAISEALRVELLEDNIRVTMIEPGAVDTELPDHITDEEARESMQSVLSGDILQPEDIAAAIAYCAVQPERVSVNEILIRPTEQAN